MKLIPFHPTTTAQCALSVFAIVQDVSEGARGVWGPTLKASLLALNPAGTNSFQSLTGRTNMSNDRLFRHEQVITDYSVAISGV
jgi:hypothetical protein